MNVDCDDKGALCYQNCHCEARLILSQRGNLLESNLISKGASAGLPRQPKFAASSQYSATLRGVRRKNSGSAEDIIK